MRTTRARSSRVLLAAALATLLLALGHAQARTDALCLIVRAESHERDLELGKVRRIFLHEATDDADGRRYIPLNAPANSAERVAFDHAVLDMGPSEVAQHWVDQRIRGVPAPRTVPRIDLTARVVARLVGAIAYVRQSQVTPEVRVLRIDGHLPGEQGYPLQ